MIFTYPCLLTVIRQLQMYALFVHQLLVSSVSVETVPLCYANHRRQRPALCCRRYHGYWQSQGRRRS